MTADAARHLIASTKAVAALVADQRSEGDKLARKGDATAAAARFEAALADHRAGVFGPLDAAFRPLPAERVDVRTLLAGQLADAHGVAGGLLRRLGREDEAAAEYTHGGQLEEAFQLPATYNRVNALMAAIRLHRLSADELTARSAALVPLARRKLQQPSQTGRGWALADLGLFLLLSGAPAAEAIDAAYIELVGISDFPAGDLHRVTGDVRECERELRALVPRVADQLRSAVEYMTVAAASRSLTEATA